MRWFAGHVHEGDARRTQSLGPGGRDIVGPEHLEHADAKAADQHRHDADGGAQTGQEEGMQMGPEGGPVAADGEPVQVDWNKTIRMMPNQNEGIPRPMSENSLTAWSLARSWCVAASAASGTVMMIAKNIATTTSDPVKARQDGIREHTGAWYSIEVPRLPCRRL